jgi:hypothetical protein
MILAGPVSLSHTARVRREAERIPPILLLILIKVLAARSEADLKDRNEFLGVIGSAAQVPLPLPRLGPDDSVLKRDKATQSQVRGSCALQNLCR